MAKAPTYNPIWKEVVLPLSLPIIIAIAGSGYINYQKSQGVEDKADVIHDLVNSRVTKLQDDFTTVIKSNGELKTEIAELRKTISDLRDLRNPAPGLDRPIPMR